METSHHASDSSEQRRAEISLRELAEVALSCRLTAETLDLGAGTKICVDGVNFEARTLCEIYSRIGPLKPAQTKKVASDMLKLMLAERSLGGSWRKVICLADPDAAKCLQGRTWLGAAAREFGIELCVLSLPIEDRTALLAAQARQVMVNRHGA